jgi:hypothetical protein
MCYVQKIYFASDFSGEYQEVRIAQRRGRGRVSDLGIFSGTLKPLYDGPRAISTDKYNDLRSLFRLIPPDAQAFYKSLKPSADVEDDITDESD